MKTIIAGSSSIEEYSHVLNAINNADIDITEIVSAGAKGVDLLGEDYAKDDDIPIKRFKPNWRIGKHAWKMCNSEMADYADALIVVWDGKSKGSKHMIDEAKKNKLIIHIHTVTKD